jgi:hypothetical protein
MGNAEVTAHILDNKTFMISTNGDGYNCDRTFTKHRDGKVEVHNDLWRTRDGTPFSGAGINIFLNQVRAARAAGVSYISTSAAGNLEQSVQGGFCGYTVWPKFGYDGNIPSCFINALPPEMKTALCGKKNIQSLLALPGGAEAWELHGGWIELKFDLSDDSPNMQALNRYVEKRRAEGTRPPRPPRRTDTRPLAEKVNEKREKLQRVIDEAIANNLRA